VCLIHPHQSSINPHRHGRPCVTMDSCSDTTPLTFADRQWSGEDVSVPSFPSSFTLFSCTKRKLRALVRTRPLSSAKHTACDFGCLRQMTLVSRHDAEAAALVDGPEEEEEEAEKQSSNPADSYEDEDAKYTKPKPDHTVQAFPQFGELAPYERKLVTFVFQPERVRP
jgi:hypothetical protein